MGGSEVMSLSPWMVAGGVVVVVLATLRWELADFMLDRIGAFTAWMRGRRLEQDSTQPKRQPRVASSLVVRDSQSEQSPVIVGC
jgi:hypothetical protein